MLAVATEMIPMILLASLTSPGLDGSGRPSVDSSSPWGAPELPLVEFPYTHVDATKKSKRHQEKYCLCDKRSAEEIKGKQSPTNAYKKASIHQALKLQLDESTKLQWGAGGRGEAFIYAAPLL